MDLSFLLAINKPKTSTGDFLVSGAVQLINQIIKSKCIKIKNVDIEFEAPPVSTNVPARTVLGGGPPNAESMAEGF